MSAKHLYRRRRKTEKSDYTKDDTVKWFVFLLLLVAIYLIIQTMFSKEHYSIKVEPEEHVVKEEAKKDVLPF